MTILHQHSSNHGREVQCTQSAGGGSYVFDGETGPQHVFARFFGTSNPYEALNCKYLTYIAWAPAAAAEFGPTYSTLQQCQLACQSLLLFGNMTPQQHSYISASAWRKVYGYLTIAELSFTPQQVPILQLYPTTQ